MADNLDKSYLDEEGLAHYHEKLEKDFLDKKVDKEDGKGLSTKDFTESDKTKLDDLENYQLPPATDETLGGVKVEPSEDQHYGNTGIKIDTNDKIFVDWSEAPKASVETPGLVTVGEGLTVEDGKISLSGEVGSGPVTWDSITDKPDDLVTKKDLVTVYQYKGTVETYDELPEGLGEDDIGHVYNVKDTGMNYAWAGIGAQNADEKGWDELGGSFSIKPISKEAIDKLFEK